MEMLISYFNDHKLQIIATFSLAIIYTTLCFMWIKVYDFTELPKSECPLEYRNKRLILIWLRRVILAFTISFLFGEF